MALICYRTWKNIKPEVQRRILLINRILGEYQTAVTVRQLYYRLVAAGVIANNDEQYKKVQGLLVRARYAGLVDWNAIEDRNREAVCPRDWRDGRQLLDQASESFRLDRWLGQHMYLELWVEKAALAGVLEPIANDYHLTFKANRGYSSTSDMKESAERIIYRCRPDANHPHGKRPVILYIGDHDPSGLHMPVEAGERLREFGCPAWLDIRPVALTWAQIQEYNPPPNPVKMEDARAERYIEATGVDTCWEADALPPDVLNLIVRTSINAYVDKERMKEVMAKEAKIKAKIKQFAATFQEG